MSAALKQSHVLDEADDAYFIGNLPAVDRLPFWGRLFVKYLCQPLERYALRKWNWSCVAEGQAVCKSVTSAEKMCEGKPRWFWLKVPVERPLPEVPIAYGHSFPASPKRRMYENLKSPLSVVESDRMKDLERSTRELREIL